MRNRSPAVARPSQNAGVQADAALASKVAHARRVSDAQVRFAFQAACCCSPRYGRLRDDLCHANLVCCRQNSTLAASPQGMDAKADLPRALWLVCTVPDLQS